MSWDLALDYNTGDLLVAPSGDIAVRTGREVVEQQIRVRLRIRRGEWPLDPTEGQLGSSMRDLMRVPAWQAVADTPRIIREALAPMTNVHINDITAKINDDDPRKIDALLRYTILDETGEVEGEELLMNTTILIAG